MRVPQPIELQLACETAGVRVVVAGELDVATAPRLEECLRRLHARGRHVVLDLARVEFIDVSGARVLARAVAGPRGERWAELNPQLSPAVRQLLELIDLRDLAAA